jgi:hypothetical protein
VADKEIYNDIDSPGGKENEKRNNIKRELSFTAS